MKSLKVVTLVALICIVISNTFAFADTAQEEFLKYYDDYWNSVYEKNGYSSYEEYAEDYYKSQNTSNKSRDDDEDYQDDKDEDTYSETKKKSKKQSSAKNKTVKQNENLENYNLQFGEKTIEECPKESYLYINNYNMKKFSPEICTPSPYHYDSTKTLYFYPVYDNGIDYISFMVLNQDNLSNCDNALVIYNYCQFMLNEDGTWSKDRVLKNGNTEIITTCDEELTNYNKALNQLKNDLLLLYHTDNSYNKENVLNQEWYIHSTDDQITQNYKEMYFIISKSKNKFYILSSEKRNEATKQQEIGKLGFQYVNQMSELAYEFDKCMKEYLNLVASMNTSAI